MKNIKQSRGAFDLVFCRQTLPCDPTWARGRASNVCLGSTVTKLRLASSPLLFHLSAAAPAQSVTSRMALGHVSCTGSVPYRTISCSLVTRVAIMLGHVSAS
eukprot:3673956-Rhodomonas_salina.2